jgi:hypothetical protein
MAFQVCALRSNLIESAKAKFNAGFGWRTCLGFESDNRGADQARSSLEDSTIPPLTMKAEEIAGPVGKFSSTA